MSHQSDSSLLDIYSYLSQVASLANGIVITLEIAGDKTLFCSIQYQDIIKHILKLVNKI